MKVERWRSELLAVTLAIVSRGLMARDALLGVTRRLRVDGSREEFFFASGKRRLAAALLLRGQDAPVVLICHGIGETVEHWGLVQAWLGDRGVGSMVFNYSGYGRSSGRVRTEHCDEDLVAAYAALRRKVDEDADVFVLGFSLGSGIAARGAAGLNPPVAGLFLCEAFTSFREAACAAGSTKWMARMVPDVWNTVEAVRGTEMPVWVLHSDGDKLFPVQMGRRIAEACGERGELVVLKGQTHNEPYLRPTAEYWGPVVARIGRRRGQALLRQTQTSS